MTLDESGRLVAAMLASVPSHRVDSARVADMVRTYADLLGDLAFAECLAALRVLLQTRTWLPSVADIRATVAELHAGPVRAGGDAWGAVVRAIAAEGAYREPGRDFAFGDPVTARVVSAFGWGNLCASENQVADRARFVELYDKLAAQHRREAQSPVLAAAREKRALGVVEHARQAIVERTAKALTGGRS